MPSGGPRMRNRICAGRWAQPAVSARLPPGSGLSLFHQERYDAAIDTLHRMFSLPSPLSEDYATLISAYGHVGRRAVLAPPSRNTTA